MELFRAPRPLESSRGVLKHLGSLWELLGSLEEILSSLWEPLWSLWEHLASLWKARRPESIRSMICDGVCVKVCDLGFDMNCFFGATLSRGGALMNPSLLGGRGSMPDSSRANMDAFGHTFARGVCSST